MSTGNNSVKAQWVYIKYQGDKAKSVAAHMREGVGSYLEMKNEGNELLVALRVVGEIKDNMLIERNPANIQKLNDRLAERQGQTRKTNKRPLIPKAVDSTFFDNQRKDIA